MPDAKRKLNSLGDASILSYFTAFYVWDSVRRASKQATLGPITEAELPPIPASVSCVGAGTVPARAREEWKRQAELVKGQVGKDGQPVYPSLFRMMLALCRTKIYAAIAISAFNGLVGTMAKVRCCW